MLCFEVIFILFFIVLIHHLNFVYFNVMFLTISLEFVSNYLMTTFHNLIEIFYSLCLEQPLFTNRLEHIKILAYQLFYLWFTFRRHHCTCIVKFSTILRYFKILDQRNKILFNFIFLNIHYIVVYESQSISSSSDIAASSSSSPTS